MIRSTAHVGVVWSGRANDIGFPWSARTVLNKFDMTDMQQIFVGMNEWNERVRTAEARATDAERQAQATKQELVRSRQARGEVAAPAQQEQGIGAFASKYQPHTFDAEHDKWREWVRVFRSRSGRFFGGALTEVYEHVEGL